MARYRACGIEVLADRSHRPASCPHQTADDVEATVCDLRGKHPRWGPQRLRDELLRRARVCPVLVGGGIPFFPQRERRVDLELVETRTFSSRVVYLRYRVAR